MGYTDSLAHYYDLSTPVALPDLGIPGGNPGTGANIASNPVGIHGKSTCASFNGNNSNYNLGDVAELNEATAFTICFWMRQDVIDVTDEIFRKPLDATHAIAVSTNADGNMYFVVSDGAAQFTRFDYSTRINAGQWYHLAYVYDGSQVVDAAKFNIYVDATLATLTLGGTHPTQTADLSGQDAFIGFTSGSFDGLLDAFAIFSRPLTMLQVNDHLLATRQNRL